MKLRRGIMAAKARLKDPDAQRGLEAELLDSVEMLEHSANSALAALFLVGTLGRGPWAVCEAPVTIIHSMLMSCAFGSAC